MDDQANALAIETALVTDTELRRDTDNMTDILRRIVKDQDNGRLDVLTYLINTTNFAVQVQGGRKNWDRDDTRAFCVAMGALDTINRRNIATIPEEEVEHYRHASKA